MKLISFVLLYKTAEVFLRFPELLLVPAEKTN